MHWRLPDCMRCLAIWPVAWPAVYGPRVQYSMCCSMQGDWEREQCEMDRATTTTTTLLWIMMVPSAERGSQSAAAISSINPSITQTHVSTGWIMKALAAWLAGRLTPSLCHGFGQLYFWLGPYERLFYSISAFPCSGTTRSDILFVELVGLYCG